MDFTKEICAALPDICLLFKVMASLILLAIGTFVLLAIVAFVAFLIWPGYRHGRCPKCGKGLREEALDHPIWEDGTKHTYRDFYLKCSCCKYSEKEKGQSELIT